MYPCRKLVKRWKEVNNYREDGEDVFLKVAPNDNLEDTVVIMKETKHQSSTSPET